MKLSINEALFFLLGILTQIEASGYVEIKLISYYNQGGITKHGRYCDRSIFFNRRTSSCDLKFSFKLDGKKGGLGPDWPKLKSHTYHNMDNVKFESYFGTSNKNPFKLDFKTWQGRLNFKVEAHDIDTLTSHDHVDTLKTTISVRPDNVTRRTSITSTFHGHRAKLFFTYKVACDPFYFGSFCMKYCRPADNSYGHFTCGILGNRYCLPGWRDPENACLTKITPCDKIKCQNGGSCFVHLNKPVCNCTVGYEGHRCQNAIVTSSTSTRNTVSTTQEIKEFTTQSNNHERKRSEDPSKATVTTRKPLNKGTTNDRLTSTRKPSTKSTTKDQSTSSNTSDAINVYAGNVAANVDRDTVKDEETKVAGIHPAIFTIPLFLVILLLIGALYHQRQRLHKAFSIMKLSNSPGGNAAEVGNIYTEGLIEHNSEGRVRYVSNNTYNVDPSFPQNDRKSEDGSLYGSISSKSDTDEEEIMDEGLYSMPRDPRRYRNEKENCLTPPSLPPRDSNKPVSLTVDLPDHLEGDNV